jgi:hypothetical protein
MSPASVGAIAAIGALLLGATAVAQPVYRCGNAYGTQPCAQGKVLESDDARTAEQRERALRLVAAEKRQGDDMERDRLRREAALRPALASALSSAPAPAAKAPEKRPLPKKRASKAKSATKQIVAFVPTVKEAGSR